MRVLDLVRGMFKRGDQVALACLRGGEMADDFAELGVDVFNLESWSGNLGAICGLISIVISWRPDIVHSHLFASTTLSRAALLILRLPLFRLFFGFGSRVSHPMLVSTIHGIEKSRYWFMERLFSGLSHKIISVSHFLSRHFHDGSEKIAVIPGGIDLEQCHCFRKPLADDQIVIGTLGRLSRVKGIDILLGAVALLEPCLRRKIIVRIGGPGPEADNLLELAGKLNLLSQVEFSGQIADIDGFMNSLDIFVMPSRQEGQGLSMLEAMARGRIVIAARAGGIPEHLIHGKNGLLFGRENSESLAMAMEWVCSNRERAQEISAEARRSACSGGDRKIMVDKVRALYGQLRSPRLLLVISSGSMGGGERNFLQIACHFKSLGWKISAVVTGSGRLMSALIDSGIPVISLPLETPLGGLASLPALVRLVCAGRYDLIHGHLNRGALISSLAAAIAGVPSIVTVHGLNRKVYYRFADRVIAVCQAAADNLIEQSLPEGFIRVVQNGVAVSDESFSDGAACFPASEGKVVFGMVARLHPNKGHETAIRALAIVAADGKCPFQCELQIVGEGDSDYQRKLEMIATDLGVSERVHFTGHSDDPSRLMQGWKCLLIPSFQEAFPFVALEALSSGVAVIGSRVGGLPEILGDDGDTNLVPAGDPASLARRMMEILKMGEGDFQALRQRGFKRVAENFSIGESMASIERVYRELLSCR
jgi:glycosyltransferase involved in cell wall biosynthesis